MTPTRPAGKSAPCNVKPAFCRPPRSNDDARVSVVRSAEAARIELVAEVAGLARAAETGDRAREAHHRHDLAPRAHSRIPAGTWRVADHLNLEAEPRARVEHPDENGNCD